MTPEPPPAAEMKDMKRDDLLQKQISISIRISNILLSCEASVDVLPPSLLTGEIKCVLLNLQSLCGWKFSEQTRKQSKMCVFIHMLHCPCTNLSSK